MFPHPTRRPAARLAFSLVELLVAMAVLVLLIISVAQLVGSATAVTTGGRKRLDADSQARIVFDRMALDFSKMVKRGDVSYLFAKDPNGTSTTGGNDTMYFYSEAPGFYTSATKASSVVLAGYRINKAYQLERLGKGLTWDGISDGNNPGGMVFLSLPANAGNSYKPDDNSTLAGQWSTVLGNSKTYNDGSDDSYHVLADQVFRLEFCYQLLDGTYSTVPVLNPTGITSILTSTSPPDASKGSPNYSVGSRWYDKTTNCAYVCTNSAPGAAVWKFSGMQDVRAVVVAMAVLDSTSAKTVPLDPAVTVSAGHSVQPPRLTDLVKDFADAPLPEGDDGHVGSNGSTKEVYLPATSATPARLMAEAWNNQLKELLSSGAPPINKTALGQVRIYQRYFAVNTGTAASK